MLIVDATVSSSTNSKQCRMWACMNRTVASNDHHCCLDLAHHVPFAHIPSNNEQNIEYWKYEKKKTNSVWKGRRRKELIDFIYTTWTRMTVHGFWNSQTEHAAFQASIGGKPLRRLRSVDCPVRGWQVGLLDWRVRPIRGRRWDGQAAHITSGRPSKRPSQHAGVYHHCDWWNPVESATFHTTCSHRSIVDIPYRDYSW